LINSVVRIECPVCYSTQVQRDENENLYCFQCEDSWEVEYIGDVYKPQCHCEFAEDSIWCEDCEVKRESVYDPWQWMEDDELQEIFSSENELYTLVKYSKCRHYNQNINFTDGTVIYASSLFDREKEDETPDFGLYLDPSWEPDCMAYTLFWEDYGLPENWRVAVNTIIDTYKKAQKGYWVEVGCIGGHGRTGTVIAAMAVLSGMRFDEAVEWTRKQYCSHAIETKEQEWWVEWFEAYVFGGETSVFPSKIPVDAKVYSYQGDLGWEDIEFFQQPLNNRRKPSVEPVYEVKEFSYKRKLKPEEYDDPSVVICDPPSKMEDYEDEDYEDYEDYEDEGDFADWLIQKNSLNTSEYEPF
jgi:protein-tyrosine phosphatase